MNGIKIMSTGSYLPEKVVHNEAFSQFPDAAKFMISQKTGVFSRRQAGEDECTSDIALKAAQNCLEKIGFPPENLNGIIVSTSSPDRIQPATATRVQRLLGASGAFAFDINSVCSGSTYGIATAGAMIKSGLCENVLFIAAEVYSKILNKKDFSTYPFFGDGSGAVFFHADESHNGVVHSILRTDGGGSEVIYVPAGGTMKPFRKMKSPTEAFFRMKGKDVFQFAVTRGAEVIREITEQTGMLMEDIKAFVCHQANVNILLQIAEKLGISIEKFYMNLFRYGNTASASVPIALDEAISRGEIGSGDRVVTAAFGGGLSWGANLLHL